MKDKTANDIRQAISKLEIKSARDLAKLKTELSLIDSPFNVGNVLQSTLNPAHSFMVVGSDEDGLTGVLRDSTYVLKASDNKNWKVSK